MFGKGELLERAAARLNFQKFGNAGGPSVVLDDGHEARCIAIRQRIEECGFQQSENRRRAADPQGEHAYDEAGHSGVAA